MKQVVWSRSILLLSFLAIQIIAMPVFASMVYYCPESPLPVPVSHSGSLFLSLDLNFDLLTDITLFSNGSDFYSVPQGSNEVIALIPPPPDLGAWVIPLPLGSDINAAPATPGVWEGALTTPGFASCQAQGCIGLWLYPNADAYFGIRFDIAGDNHYGWVHLINTYGLTGEVIEWSYESLPDTGVIAGAVPEPSSVLLVVVGVVMTILRSRRSDSGF